LISREYGYIPIHPGEPWTLIPADIAATRNGDGSNASGMSHMEAVHPQPH
jgi:hypothetical protein